MINQFKNIKESDKWINIIPLNKGWSNDKKFIVTDNNFQKYLLRISSIELFEKKKNQFKLLEKVSKLDILSSKPISFGKLNNNEIYMIMTYIEGEDAEEYIKKVTDIEAYNLGVKAGRILKELHKIEVPYEEINWNNKYQEKMQKKFKIAKECPRKIKDLDLLIDYIQKNLDLVKNRPQLFTHGDYHVGNLIVNNDEIGVIDFDKSQTADPYDDFKPFCWNVFISEYFETGLINGYFDNQIPQDFFPILALYAAEQLISHLPWAIQFGEKEIQIAYKVMNAIFDWYDDFNLVIPKWYKGIIE